MAKVERKHEILSEPLSEQLLEQRAVDGWKPVAVIWERRVEGAAAEPASDVEPVPYGLRVAADCRHLEEDSDEVRAMILMLRLIIAEEPFSKVARELNLQGFRTRHGAPWNQTAVFHMLPRLIEVAPDIYSSRQWLEMRGQLQQAL